MHYTMTTYINHTIVFRNGEVFAIVPRNDFVTMGRVLTVIFETEDAPF